MRRNRHPPPATPRAQSALSRDAVCPLEGTRGPGGDSGPHQEPLCGASQKSHQFPCLFSPGCPPWGPTCGLPRPRVEPGPAGGGVGGRGQGCSLVPLSPGDKLQAPGCAPAPAEAGRPALGSFSRQLLPPTLGQNICVLLGNVAPSPGPPQRGFLPRCSRLWPPAFLLGAGPEEHLSSEFTSGSAISPGAPTSYPDTRPASPLSPAVPPSAPFETATQTEPLAGQALTCGPSGPRAGRGGASGLPRWGS